MRLSDALILLTEIKKQSYRPGEWETKFMADIERRKAQLSPKQAKALIGIYQRAVGHYDYVQRQVFKR